MDIDVMSLTGTVPNPRRVLAISIVRETLGRFAARIARVRFAVPSARDPVRACVLQVLLEDGAILESRVIGVCVADVMERAAHEMRRRIAAWLCVPLCERHRVETSDPTSERRAS
jgi:hypothetical protein